MRVFPSHSSPTVFRQLDFPIPENPTRAGCHHFVNILSTIFSMAHTKHSYKFWRDQELYILKDDSIYTHKLWKAAGMPRAGPIFTKYCNCKLVNKKYIRQHQTELRKKLVLIQMICMKPCFKRIGSWKNYKFWNCRRFKIKTKPNASGRLMELLMRITDETGFYLSV